VHLIHKVMESISEVRPLMGQIVTPSDRMIKRMLASRGNSWFNVGYDHWGGSHLQILLLLEANEWFSL
jgi:hypothetical protein